MQYVARAIENPINLLESVSIVFGPTDATEDIIMGWQLIACMAQQRTRDRVWKYALAKTYKGDGAAKPAEIAEIADVSERTARETLTVISETGWLERDVLEDGSVRFLPSDNVETNFPG